MKVLEKNKRLEKAKLRLDKFTKSLNGNKKAHSKTDKSIKRDFETQP